MLSSIDFWSFQPLMKYTKIIQLLVILCFCLFLVLSGKNKKSEDVQMYFRNYVLCFMLLPFFSIIPCYLIHGQDLVLSVWTMRLWLCWLFYFVLHRMHISEKELIKICIFIAAIWVFLQLIQQFTYPQYYFYTRGENADRIEVRAGILRYMIAGVSFGVIAFFYYLQNFYTIPKRSRTAIYILFFLLGIYLYMTRQILVTALFCMLIAPIMLNTKKINKKLLFFIGSCFLLGAIYLLKNHFMEMIEQTTSELDEDNIRIASYLFYTSYWDNWSCFLFGNGFPHETSNYGKYIYFLEKDLGMYRDDIGIFGELNKYGIIYIISYISFIIYFFRKSNQIDLYLKLYLIFILLTMFMIFPFRWGGEFLFFSVFLYLCDLSISKNKIQERCKSRI